MSQKPVPPPPGSRPALKGKEAMASGGPDMIPTRFGDREPAPADLWWPNLKATLTNPFGHVVVVGTWALEQAQTGRLWTIPLAFLLAWATVRAMRFTGRMFHL